jgi:hypothetical protein
MNETVVQSGQQGRPAVGSRQTYVFPIPNCRPTECYECPRCSFKDSAAKGSAATGLDASRHTRISAEGAEKNFLLDILFHRMSEMGETESLRLQMAMDRLSKMMSTLSNLLKKMSDTADGITRNLR